MREDRQKFLNILGQPPARLSVEQTAWVLNCQPHDIPMLTAAKLLKPLGNPPANGQKFYATSVVMELARDANWLARATNAIHHHWQRKNSRRTPASPNGRYQLGNS